MMQIKELYKYDCGRQIFRLLPTDSDKIVIEERDREKKEVFFSCLDIQTGKKIFTDLQFEEKYWIGIEKIYKDVIFFHKFERPDLPNHKGIVAFDIKSQTTLWENQNKFISAGDDKVVLISNDYGITKLILVDYLSGEIITDGTEFLELTSQKEDYTSYTYANKVSQQEFNSLAHPDFKKRISEYVIKDYVNFVSRDKTSLFSFHHINSDGKFNNIFFAVDEDGTILLQETLNTGLEKIEPESFFIKNDLLFLLLGSSGFGVYKFIER
ncbi:MAG: DUF4905 domain-containing protein [Ignavibacterium album]|uniref:DUF4905 domain-containing protein n=1 Tax=Ignavibacterium album TaxID=591197 RepID=UPI0026F0919A|nr:DUF4905 domain-containing protein [Ignavibacterium album]MBI5662398.1 DUF4905 domain-containing protein [Ignavibacterium album]